MSQFLFADDGKIVINEEGEITFSTTEIQNENFVLFIAAEGVIHHLDKTVDLTELVVFGSNDLEILGEDTEVHEKGDGFTLSDEIILLTVVTLGNHDAFGFFIDRSAYFSFFRNAKGNLARFRKEIDLTEQVF